MKKFLLLCAVFLSISSAASAQFRFGGKMGVNLSNIEGSGMNTLTGFHAGFLGQYKFGPVFAIQPEALISLQGAKQSGVAQKVMDVAGKLYLGYINIPVMLQFYAVPGLDFEIGPQVGFLAYVGPSVANDMVDNMKDEMNSVDFGLNLGAAYQFPASSLGLFVRYNIGLTDIVKAQYVGYGESAGQNRVFQAGIFFRF